MLSAIVVTSLDDNTTTDGLVTLREAIQAAETDTSVDGSATGSGADVITFDSNLFTGGPQTILLTEVGNTTAGASDFGVTTNITIAGPTDNNGLTLDANGLQRLFYVGATGNLTIENLTLQNGFALGGSGGGGAAGMGGAIFNQGSLTLRQSTVSFNQAKGGSGGDGSLGGGGLGGDAVGQNGGGPNGGAFGTPVGGAGGFGGGGGAGTTTGGNGGFGGGGGNGNGVSASLGGFGGGGGNGFSGGGGGFGGGRGALGGGGGGGGAGLGGAIFNAAGSVTIYNSTLTGNSALGGNGGNEAVSGSGFGGALFNLNGSVNVTNATLANNFVAAGSAIGDAGQIGSADGGAVYTLGLNGVRASAVSGQTATIGTAAGAQATFVNSIFANSFISPYAYPNGGDPVGDVVISNSTVSGSFNLATQTGLPGGVFTSTTTAALNLDSLNSNGGPTQTMALLSGSSALATGFTSFVATTDQRYVARPIGSPSDIGAWQSSSVNTPPEILGWDVGLDGCNSTVTGSLTFTDPDFDSHTVTINWGDGSDPDGDLVVGETFVIGVTSGDVTFDLNGLHTYAAFGTYTITATVTDSLGASSTTETLGSVTVGATATVGYDAVWGGNVLDVHGTDLRDVITVNQTQSSSGSQIIVHTNSGPDFVFSAAGIVEIRVHLCDGDDLASMSSGLAIGSIVYGEAGNDHINAGKAPAIILGGVGNDDLVGGAGRDLLIGGTGADRIVGSADDDILIAGYTKYDGEVYAANEAALKSIMGRWDTTATYASRVAAVQSTFYAYNLLIDNAPSAPGTGNKLQTVFSDTDVDLLTGSAGSDLFFANLVLDDGGLLDKITDLSTTKKLLESALDIDLT